MTDVITTETIPEAALAVLGHNSGMAHYGDVTRLEQRLGLLGDALTQTTAPLMRDVMKDAHDKAGTLEEDRKSAQVPHQERIDEIRAAYRPFTERALGVKEAARKRLDAFLAAEDLRIRNEARDAAQRVEEARQAALKARAEAEASPFAQEGADDAAKELAELEVDQEYAQRAADNGPSVASAAGTSRAAGYRTTYSVKVLDKAKLVNKFKAHPDVIAAAEKLANAMARATKGAAPIPGCEIVETRRAA